MILMKWRGPGSKRSRHINIGHFCLKEIADQTEVIIEHFEHVRQYLIEVLNLIEKVTVQALRMNRIWTQRVHVLKRSLRADAYLGGVSATY